MATPVATAFVRITAPTLRPDDLTVGIQYTDGKVLSLSVRGYLVTSAAQLRTSAQIAALGWSLAPIPIETTMYPMLLAMNSHLPYHVQPCTIVYPTASVAAISVFSKLIFRGATAAAADGAITTQTTLEILKGATIYSRRGANGRPWGAVTNTASGFGQYAVG